MSTIRMGSYSLGFSLITWCNIDFITPFHLSTNPLASGYPGVENRGAAPNLWNISVVSCEVKFVPWSEAISTLWWWCGMPTLVKTSKSASTVAFAVNDLRGEASIHLVHWSIIRKYIFVPSSRWRIYWPNTVYVHYLKGNIWAWNWSNRHSVCPGNTTPWLTT